MPSLEGDDAEQKPSDAYNTARGSSDHVGAPGTNPQDAAALDTSVTLGAADASAAPGYDAAKTQGGVWTNRTRGTRASGQIWTAVASNALGDRLVATSTIVIPQPMNVESGFWTSTNGGLTWTNSDGPPEPSSVASSSDGTVLIADEGIGTSGGRIWMSTNSGVTWGPVPGTSLLESWGSVASDSSGTQLVAGSFDGDIWTSSNSGATWTDRTPSGPAHNLNWPSIASNSAGTKLIAVSALCCGGINVGGPGAMGDIWTSADSGVTWIDRTPTGPAHAQSWASAASDSSGMNLIAVGSGIWTSADAGLTWTEQTAPSSLSRDDWWISVASDATGKRLIAATAYDPLSLGSTGNIYTSADGGVTWTNETAGTAAEGQDWLGVASDSLGVHRVAVERGDIWTN